MRAFMLLLALVSVPLPVLAKNGFDLSGGSIPAEEILPGGPPRDGIPAIDNPMFESVAEANWLRPDDRVIGVERNGIAKAYPIRILNWHEIVNDEFAGEAVLVTFCPLCGTGIVFDPVEGEFGVSGLLYNSDVLLYDRATESLWSQILARAVTGTRKDEKLRVLPSRHTTWEQWHEQWPASLVLSRITGHSRDYSRDPYAGYDKNSQILFPLANRPPEDGLHPKERVLGLTVGGVTKAYPFSALAVQGEASFTDEIGGTTLIIHWNAQAPTAWATTSAGEEFPGVDGFWFAWYAFHPATEIYSAQ